MRSCTRRIALALLGAVLLAPGPVHAAGFALFEQGAKGMGFAGAFTAQSSDPSAIFHNAAGIAFLKGKQLYVGGNLVHPVTSFLGTAPYPGPTASENASVGWVPIPAVYYAQQFSDRLSFGVGVNAPFGLEMSWESPEVYTGRFISQNAELRGISVNPTVAWKVEDRLAVGLGLDLRFSKLKLQRRAAVVNPYTLKVADAADVDLESNTAHGIGFNVGVLAKPNDAFSVGLAYRHKVKVDYDGTASFRTIPTGYSQLDARVVAALPTGGADLTTSIEFPAIASLGVAYHWGDWTAEGDVNWYQWSTFQSLDLVFTERTDLNQSITENYKNTWQFRAGLQRLINEAFTVRGGYFYDQSPAPAESVSPLLPDATRHGIALGGTWHTGSWTVDAAGWYLLSPDRSTEGVNRDSYDGVYSSHAITLGLSLGYAF